jgi:hypothetical protein
VQPLCRASCVGVQMRLVTSPHSDRLQVARILSWCALRPATPMGLAVGLLEDLTHAVDVKMTGGCQRPGCMPFPSQQVAGVKINDQSLT